MLYIPVASAPCAARGSSRSCSGGFDDCNFTVQRFDLDVTA